MAFHGNCIFFLLGLMILSVLVRVLVGGLRAHHTPSVPRDVAGHRQTPHGDVQSEGDAKENAQAMLVPDKGSAPKANKPVPVEGATTGAAMLSKDEAKYPPPLRPPELLLSRHVSNRLLERELDKTALALGESKSSIRNLERTLFSAVYDKRKTGWTPCPKQFKQRTPTSVSDTENIVVILLDSVSLKMGLRALPLSMDVLVNNGATFHTNYNIVGKQSEENQFPIAYNTSWSRKYIRNPPDPSTNIVAIAKQRGYATRVIQNQACYYDTEARTTSSAGGGCIPYGAEVRFYGEHADSQYIVPKELERLKGRHTYGRSSFKESDGFCVDGGYQASAVAFEQGRLFFEDPQKKRHKKFLLYYFDEGHWWHPPNLLTPLNVIDTHVSDYLHDVFTFYPKTNVLVVADHGRFMHKMKGSQWTKLFAYEHRQPLLVSRLTNGNTFSPEVEHQRLTPYNASHFSQHFHATCIQRELTPQRIAPSQCTTGV